MLQLDAFLLKARELSRDAFVAEQPRAFLLLKLDERADPEPWSFKTSTIASERINVQQILAAADVEVEPDFHHYRAFPLVKADSNPWRERVSVGRARNNDIVLPDSSISKLHAYFTFDEQAHAYVRDAGSRNGTRVGERRVKGEAVSVNNGDVVTFGGLSLTYLDTSGLYDFVRGMLRERQS